MMYLPVILLGILEGFTEFLPISSTGHLVLLEDLLGFRGPPGKVFEVVIQVGAIAAVILLYFQRCWRLCAGFFSSAVIRRQVYALLLAFFPAAFLGFFVHDFITLHLFHPRVVAMSLILGGIVMLWAEKRQIEDEVSTMEALPLRTALLIGCFQTIAMIPGVSRSGATIIGARLLGVSRLAATEFSFFLAIPTLLGASAYSFYKYRHELSDAHLTMMGIGAMAAFITALLVVKWLIRFIQHHNFIPFAWYRIGLGCLLLCWLYGVV